MNKPDTKGRIHGSSFCGEVSHSQIHRDEQTGGSKERVKREWGGES